MGTWTEDLRGILASLGCLIGDSPCPISVALEENQTEEVPPVNPTHSITSVFAHLDQTAAVFHESRIVYDIYQRC